MKALSLMQPWASLLSIGAKTHETRGWSTKYRGPLLIHASKAWTLRMALLCYQEPYFRALRAAGIELPARCDGTRLPYFLPTGAIIAVAQLVDCRPTPSGSHYADRGRAAWPASDLDRAFGNWEPGRFAWQLEDVRPLRKPVECAGKLNLWEPDEDLLSAVHAELAA